MNQSLSQIISQPVMSFTQCMNQTDKQSLSWLVNQSINNSINQSINQSIKQSINQSFNQSIKQSINQSINHSINHSNNQSINQSTNHSNNQLINQSNNQFINDWVVTLSLQMKSRGVSMMKDKLSILSDGTNKIPFYKMKLQIVTVFLLKWLKTARTATFISEKCFTQFSLIF